MMNLVNKYYLNWLFAKPKDFVFVHIQKTAGKSIRQALGLKKGANHNSAQQWLNEYTVDEWNNAFKFTFVRNPWDRLLSSYMYRRLAWQPGRVGGCFKSRRCLFEMCW